MDFLEGFLMGPVWSDTEYETRPHVGFFWFIGWLFLAVFAAGVVYPEKMPALLRMPSFLPYLIFLLLAFVTPLLCRYYYRMILIVKLIILAVLAIKYGMGFIAFLQFWQARISIDLATMPTQVLEYINAVIAQATNYFAAMGDGTSMLVGIIAGGAVIVLTFAAVLLIATILPALFLAVMKLIQRGIDQLAAAALFKSID